eukprot:TRINITY_DN167_c0_g1_i1.p1 TRINITY_DN167_c0_g1~~TRINITY_DN167_c0_g1_i1.p1  ORF type:complete len:223 (+),score=66.28 TRINITY_DN167_c0_g1_i1:50-670(+)
MEQYDYLQKIILVGDSGVGKSALMMRFADDYFNDGYICTIGVDFKIRTVKHDSGKVVKMQIWDTSGQDRFRAITRSYYHGATTVFVVFDTTDVSSFHSVGSWMKEVDNYSPEDIQTLLVGTKTDMEAKREVTVEEAQDLGEKLGMNYVETSSKLGTNVDQIFDMMMDDFVELQKEKELVKQTERNNLKIDEGTAIHGKSACQCLIL